MTPVVIREAESDDCNALLSLIHAHARFERAEATITSKGLSRLLNARAPQASVFVAARHGQVLGFTALTSDYCLWRDSVYAHLDCLFVAPEARGRGIGAELLDRVKTVSRARGIGVLEWQTPDWNERGIAFYKREGAAGQGKMRFSLNLRPDQAP